MWARCTRGSVLQCLQRGSHTASASCPAALRTGNLLLAWFFLWNTVLGLQVLSSFGDPAFELPFCWPGGTADTFFGLGAWFRSHSRTMHDMIASPHRIIFIMHATSTTTTHSVCKTRHRIVASPSRGCGVFEPESSATSNFNWSDAIVLMQHC